MKKYFYFAIVSLVMFSCENEDLDEISSKANNTANIAPLSSLYYDERLFRASHIIDSERFAALYSYSE